MIDEPQRPPRNGKSGDPDAAKPAPRRRGRPRSNPDANGSGAPGDGPAVIKKYANRRLYDTGASKYVTLEDLAVMVREGREFVVQDARTGEDITRPVLGQIIFEQEAKDGPSLLPTEFLRQIISYYGDQMGAVVPSYLEQSMAAFQRSQDEMRAQLTKVMGGQLPDPTKVGHNMTEMAAAPLKAVEEQARRNVEMFQKAMAMFSPFAVPGGATKPEPYPEAPSGEKQELDELRAQIAAMQAKVDKLGE